MCKVKRYIVYSGEKTIYINAVNCITLNNRVSFLSASGKIIAEFNWNEITGYKLEGVYDI